MRARRAGRGVARSAAAAAAVAAWRRRWRARAAGRRGRSRRRRGAAVVPRRRSPSLVEDERSHLSLAIDAEAPQSGPSKRRSLLLFDSPLQGAPSPAPILSPRILHIPCRRAARPRPLGPRPARRPAAPARRAQSPPRHPPPRRRAPRRGAAARRRARPRCSSRPSPSSWTRPRRATHAARSRRARASCAAPRRAVAATRERERARQVENSLGEWTHVRCCLLAFYLQGARTAQLQHGALDAAARRRSTRIRRPRRCGRDQRFRFSPVRTHALLLHLSSRGHLLELASAAPLLSFMASASLRSSSARNSARSGRPRRQVRGDHFTTVRRGRRPTSILQLPHKARVLRRATLQHANTPVDVQATSTSIGASVRVAVVANGYFHRTVPKLLCRPLKPA